MEKLIILKIIKNQIIIFQNLEDYISKMIMMIHKMQFLIGKINLL